MRSIGRNVACLMAAAVMGHAADMLRPLEPVTWVTTEVTKVELLLTPEHLSDVSAVSWYGPGFHGRLTASGKVYDMNGISAAHREFKFGTEVLFVNFETGEWLVVPVTDRGPYSKWKGVKYYEGDRDFDLSLGAADKLSVVQDGVVPLHWTVIG